MSSNTNEYMTMSLASCILTVWAEARSALNEMSSGERWFHVFWLLGPLILLIERSPADIWLSICVLGFVFRALKTQDGSWLKVFWVKAVFAFWGVCIFSAAMSKLPLYSLGEAIIWIRFPLFVMASCFWFAKDRRLLYAMMGMTILGMFAMASILTAEIFIEGQKGGRLTWPYGDLVPGNYLAKVGLPAIVFLTTVSVTFNRAFAIPAALLILFTVVMSIMAGERINFIIVACSILLAAISSRPNIPSLILLLSFKIATMGFLLLLRPSSAYRFIDRFIGDSPLYSESPYLRVWNGAIDAFQSSVLIGIGPDNYRLLCSQISAGASDVDCHTHPHNYYLQMSAETGLLGLFMGSVMIVSLIWFSFLPRLRKKVNAFALTAFVVPLGLFFPIQSTSDFFGQWNNIFMWSAIALAMSAGNLTKETARFDKT